MRALLIGFLALLPAGSVAAQNDTPGRNTMHCFQANQWDLGDAGLYPRVAFEAQGYEVTSSCETADPGTSPAVTAEDFRRLLGGQYGGFFASGHMSAAGLSVQSYAKTPEGWAARSAALAILQGSGYAVSGTESPGAWLIAYEASAVASFYNSSNSIVMMAGCNSLSWCTPDVFDGSRWRGGYGSSVPASTIPADMLLFAANLNGAGGKSFRECTTALTGTSFEGDASNSPTVLAPVVTNFSPAENTELWETVPGWVEFDCTMKQSDPDFAVWGLGSYDGGDCMIENARWATDTRLEFDIHPLRIGTCYVEVSSGAVSNGGMQIDGNTNPPYTDGVGPNGDGLRIQLASKVNDSVVAFGIGGAWAYDETDGTHVFWVTDPERGSVSFDVFGGSNRQVLLATVAAQGSKEKQYCYEVVVPSGHEVFEIVEEDHDPSTEDDASRPFKRANRPPDNLESLRSMNRIGATRPAALFAALKQVEPPDIPLMPNPCPDYVIVSPRQDFLDATLPVQQYLEGPRGKMVAAILLDSGDPSEVRDIAYQYWLLGRSGAEKVPQFIMVGEANQGSEPLKNVIGTVHYADTTGAAYWEPAASDIAIVDFDGDQLPDMPWMRVPAYQLSEVQNSVQTALEFYNGQHVLSHRAFIMDGDLSAVCQPTVEPRQTLDEAQALYNQNGISTIVRHDSEYSDCGGWAERLADGAAIVNAGVGEVFGIGNTTNRSILPAFIFQKVYSPVFTMSAVPTPQRVVFQFPGCGIGDMDRDNLGYYPSIPKMFLTADPDLFTTAVAWLAHMRGGYRVVHGLFGMKYLEHRFSGTSETLQEAYFYAIRDLGMEEPGLRGYLLMAGSFGWPVWIDQMSVGVEDTAPPVEAILLSNAPNPFNPRTTIRYTLSANARVELDVFDVRGRLIRNLLCTLQPAGQHSEEWDGTDNLGRRLASGNFYARLKLDGRSVGARGISLVK